MMHYMSIIISFILLSPSLGDNVDTIVSKLQKKYDTIRDATVEFIQKIKFDMTENEQSYEGKLIMKRKNKFYIEMNDQIIVTDGVSAWLYSKTNNQVIIDHYRDTPQLISPEKILTDFWKYYSIMLLNKEIIGNRYNAVLKLTPLDEMSTIKWIKIWVDTDEWIINKIETIDMSGSTITYIIKQIRQNTGISDKQFQFIFPPDSDVIDLR